VRQALLVRHCESLGPAPAASLSERGHEQALALAEFLAAHPVDHLASSPYLRARQTIEPFARRSGLAIAIHDGLRERELSAEPLPAWREIVRRSFSEPELRAPGGESAAEVRSRAWTAIRSILGGGHRLPVLASHGQLLSLVLSSIDARFGYEEWLALTNPDVLLLSCDDALHSFRFDRIWR